MKKIYSVALNLHDHNTYDGVFHNQRERYTRFKHNLPYHAEAYNHQSDIINPGDYRLNNEFVREYWDTNKRDGTNGILAFTYTYGGIRMCKDMLPQDIFNYDPKYKIIILITCFVLTNWFASIIKLYLFICRKSKS